MESDTNNVSSLTVNDSDGNMEENIDNSSCNNIESMDTVDNAKQSGTENEGDNINCDVNNLIETSLKTIDGMATILRDNSDSSLMENPKIFEEIEHSQETISNPVTKSIDNNLEYEVTENSETSALLEDTEVTETTITNTNVGNDILSDNNDANEINTNSSGDDLSENTEPNSNMTNSVNDVLLDSNGVDENTVANSVTNSVNDALLDNNGADDDPGSQSPQDVSLENIQTNIITNSNTEANENTNLAEDGVLENTESSSTNLVKMETSVIHNTNDVDGGVENVTTNATNMESNDSNEIINNPEHVECENNDASNLEDANSTNGATKNIPYDTSRFQCEVISITSNTESSYVYENIIIKTEPEDEHCVEYDQLTEENYEIVKQEPENNGESFGNVDSIVDNVEMGGFGVRSIIGDVEADVERTVDNMVDSLDICKEEEDCQSLSIVDAYSLSVNAGDAWSTAKNTSSGRKLADSDKPPIKLKFSRKQKTEKLKEKVKEMVKASVKKGTVINIFETSKKKSDHSPVAQTKNKKGKPDQTDKLVKKQLTHKIPERTRATRSSSKTEVPVEPKKAKIDVTVFVKADSTSKKKKSNLKNDKANVTEIKVEISPKKSTELVKTSVTPKVHRARMKLMNTTKKGRKAYKTMMANLGMDVLQDHTEKMKTDTSKKSGKSAAPLKESKSAPIVSKTRSSANKGTSTANKSSTTTKKQPKKELTVVKKIKKKKYISSFFAKYPKQLKLRKRVKVWVLRLDCQITNDDLLRDRWKIRAGRQHLFTMEDSSSYRCKLCDFTGRSENAILLHIGSMWCRKVYAELNAEEPSDTESDIKPTLPIISKAKKINNLRPVKDKPITADMLREVIRCTITVQNEHLLHNCLTMADRLVQDTEEYQRNLKRLQPPKVENDDFNGFICIECSRRFTREDQLQTHMRRHLSKDCPYCDENLLEDELQVHIMTDHDPETNDKVCPECFRLFKTVSGKDAHIAHRHSFSFTCDYCPEVYNAKRDLSRHIKKVHPDKFFTCEVCDATFALKVDHDAHIGTHQGYEPFQCDICNIGFFTRTAYEKHSRIHDKAMNCPHCPRVFTRIPNFRKHVHEHENPPRHLCHNCGLEFRSQTKLNSHTNNKCAEMSIPCKWCNATFSKKNALSLHIRKVHREEDPPKHTCEKCGKEFWSENGYTAHCAIEDCTLTPPQEIAICQTCGKKFPDAHSCKKHHSNIHAEKRFTCRYCGMKFGERSRLGRHIRLHTLRRTIPCEVCKKLFRDRAHLQSHMRHHKSEARYKCPHCPKTFFLRTKYRTHMVTHTGEAKYQCSVCSERFKYIQPKQAHELRIHGIEKVPRQTTEFVGDMTESQRQAILQDSDKMLPYDSAAAIEHENPDTGGVSSGFYSGNNSGSSRNTFVGNTSGAFVGNDGRYVGNVIGNSGDGGSMMEDMRDNNTDRAGFVTQSNQHVFDGNQSNQQERNARGNTRSTRRTRSNIKHETATAIANIPPVNQSQTSYHNPNSSTNSPNQPISTIHNPNPQQNLPNTISPDCLGDMNFTTYDSPQNPLNLVVDSTVEPNLLTFPSFPPPVLPHNPLPGFPTVPSFPFPPGIQHPTYHPNPFYPNNLQNSIPRPDFMNLANKIVYDGRHQK